MPRGEIFGLLGPNGAGKSTTLNLFMGFLQPTAGTARIAGLDCARDPRAVMGLVGHLPEEPALFENLTGRELDANEALARGLVSELVEPDELDAAIVRLTARIARAPREALCNSKKKAVERARIPADRPTLQL